MKTPKRVVSISMPISLYEQIKHNANQDSRTVSAEIRQILKGYLEYLERGGVSWCFDPRNRGIEQYHQ